jgi:uncharacterized protein YdhG (YjbR/CyaY superfamily)
MAPARKSTEPTTTASATFTDEERAAMQERARELKAERRRSGASAAEEGARDLLQKVAELPDAERVLAERIHTLVMAAAPHLVPRTWYGMPAYAKDGKVLCFLQPASKFKARYATFGFNDTAALDEGPMWPTSFAVIELTADVEARLTDLVRRAAG